MFLSSEIEDIVSAVLSNFGIEEEVSDMVRMSGKIYIDVLNFSYLISFC